MEHIHFKVACFEKKTMAENGVDFQMGKVTYYFCIAKDEKEAVRKAKNTISRKYYFPMELWTCNTDHDFVEDTIKNLLQKP